MKTSSLPFFACALSFSMVSMVAVAACSGSDDGGVENVTPEQAATEAANSLCDRLQECLPALIRVAYGDIATCKTRGALAVKPGFAANGSSLTPSQLAQCARDLSGISCEAITGRDMPESCRTKPGTLADGAACGTDHQCQGKLCKKPANAACGVCSKLGAAGSTGCSRNEDCDYGLGCASGTCVAFGASGVACDANRPCNPSLACKNGTCGAPLEGGENCEPSTTANPCNGRKSLVCGANRKCSELQFANAGQACGISPATVTACSGAGTCSALANGTCKASAADGAACSTGTNGPGCMQPAHCVDSVCKLDDPAACK